MELFPRDGETRSASKIWSLFTHFESVLSGSDVCTLNILKVVSSILARTYYFSIEPFFATCGQ
jgi:hypothetical protein